MFWSIVILSIISVIFSARSDAIVNCKTQYHRSCFKHWIDEDGNCLDTRQEMLQKDNLDFNVIDIENCRIVKGKWYDEYSGQYYTNTSQLDIDHIVPLKEAWESGANKWTQKQREVFANDYDNLIIVSFSLNRQKGSKDPAKWLPPRTEYQCEYIARWKYIKERYNLLMDTEEKKKIQEVETICKK